MHRLKTLPILATLLMLPCCSSPPTPPPPPPVTAPSLPPPPTPAMDWRDAPLTPGRWIYRDSAAFYGNATTPPVFTIRCDRQNRTLRLDRLLPAPATTAGTMQITTSFGDAQWPARAIDPGRPLLSVLLTSTDPALDKMAYSRGRIRIEASGAERLTLPSWPEIARVIEDCRG